MRLGDDDPLTMAEIDSSLVPENLLREARCGRLDLSVGPAGEMVLTVTASGEAYYNQPEDSDSGIGSKPPRETVAHA
jgi:hypothetical protein